MSNSLNSTQGYWANIGGDYASWWQEEGRKNVSTVEQSLIKQTVNSLKRNRLSALDLGCGTGRIISVLIKIKKIQAITGIDYSKPTLDYCRKKHGNSPKIKNFVLADISKKLPLKEESFDLITAIRVLKYSQNWEEILRECFRVIKKEGLMVFTMPNKNSITRFARCQVPLYKTTEKHLRKTLQTIGFTSIKIQGNMVLPTFVYDRLKNNLSFSLATKFEEALKKIFGQTFLSRHFFITCKRGL